MKILLLFIPILFPFCVFGQNCPEFQAVIPLKPSATASNFSFAVVADGKYHLMADRLQNGTKQTYIQFIGRMPEGFEDSRLITVFDRSDCNDSEYSLIAIKSLHLSAGDSYSALDLKNWSESSEWSHPESIWELPFIAQDSALSSMLGLHPDLTIEDLIQSLFLWEKTKTMFVIFRMIRRGESVLLWPSNSSSLGYYSINLNESCGQTYSHSKSEYLELAINSVISSLDFCFVSEDESHSSVSLLYCLSENAFQVNIIDNQFQNGSIRSEVHEIPDKYPSVSQLYPISLLCNQTQAMTFPPKMGSDIQTEYQRELPFLIRIGCRADIHWFVPISDTDDNNLDSEGYPIKSDAIESRDNHKNDTLWIVLIIIASFIIILGLVFIAILVVADRKHNQMARM